jgi:hypothetical protein
MVMIYFDIAVDVEQLLYTTGVSNNHPIITNKQK